MHKIQMGRTHTHTWVQKSSQLEETTLIINEILKTTQHTKHTHLDRRVTHTLDKTRNRRHAMIHTKICSVRQNGRGTYFLQNHTPHSRLLTWTLLCIFWKTSCVSVMMYSSPSMLCVPPIVLKFSVSTVPRLLLNGEWSRTSCW